MQLYSAMDKQAVGKHIQCLESKQKKWDQHQGLFNRSIRISTLANKERMIMKIQKKKKKINRQMTKLMMMYLVYLKLKYKTLKYKTNRYLLVQSRFIMNKYQIYLAMTKNN